MAARDSAADKKNRQLYCRLRNLATRRVRQDREASNLNLMDRYGKDPGQIWRLLDSLTKRGRSGQFPPRFVQDGQPVEGDDKLADIMNHHYTTKIAKTGETTEAMEAGLPSPLLNLVLLVFGDNVTLFLLLLFLTPSSDNMGGAEGHREA